MLHAFLTKSKRIPSGFPLPLREIASAKLHPKGGVHVSQANSCKSNQFVMDATFLLTPVKNASSQHCNEIPAIEKMLKAAGNDPLGQMSWKNLKQMTTIDCSNPNPFLFLAALHDFYLRLHESPGSGLSVCVFHTKIIRQHD